jgi:hypothetical protein
VGLRFQRRIRIAPGLRVNVSKSGIGGSMGRTGLRIGVDAKGRKYFSVGLPGTGLSYRAFFGTPITPVFLKRVVVVAVAVVLLGFLVVWMTRPL